MMSDDDPTLAPEVEVEQDAGAIPSRPRRRWGMVVALIVVSIVLLGAIAAAVWLFIQLGEARERIDEQNDEIREQREQIDKKESFGAIPSRPRRRWGMVVALTVVSIVLLGAIAAAVWLFIQLGEARERIDEQNDEIREQREQIDKKESFGAAMAGLRETIAPLAGLPFTDLVPWSQYDRLAARAWTNRRDVVALDRDIEAVNAATAEMAQKRDAARVQASSNASGSAWEETLDRLGSGWVATTLADASSACEGDALACVYDSEPFVVRVNTDGGAGDGMTDWIRTGAAYHEFAHVLQNLNPDATATALESFEGDWETMADCYALTMLPGWSLEHEVPINAYEYWEVSVGYGYTCGEDQRQVIRDWNANLGVVMRTIGG